LLRMLQLKTLATCRPREARIIFGGPGAEWGRCIQESDVIDLGNAKRACNILHMRALQRSLLAGTLLSIVASCAGAVPAANEVLAGARSRAAAEHKNIFLLFDASW